MSTQQLTGPGAAHPIAGFAAQISELLDAVAGANAWTMTPSELGEVLPVLTRARARLEALELKVLVEADRAQVGDETGASNTPAWWAHTTGQTKPAAFRALKLAAALDRGHDQVAAALSGGKVLVEQARVIIEAVDALPGDLVGPGIVAQAETRLVDLAAHHDAKDLKRLGARILEHLAPDLAEEHERRVLEAEERHAHEHARFTIADDGHGTCHGRFQIPSLHGAMLTKHLLALAAPKHHTSAGTDPGGEGGTDRPANHVSRPLRLGHAFLEYVETHSPSGIPKAGGVAATVVVTMTLDSLLGAQTAATLDTGDRVSAGEARRLACQAGLIPAVLGGPSQVLDLGRKTRLHTEPQRIALGLRDRGCTAAGCDWPPAMCHAHHPTPWSHGGETSLQNGRLLCPRHHTLAHDRRYQMKTTKHGKVCFTKRT